MAELSKLQIRAKVLWAVSEIKSAKILNEDLFFKIVQELKDVKDTKTLFDIFIKEFVKMEEEDYMYSSYILNSLVPKEYIQEKAFEEIKSNGYSDDAKYKLVQLLRTIGSTNAVDAIPKYFDNPEEVIDLETQKLMENAVYNPEAMLDFLDFIYTVSDKDKKMLLSSIKNDYQGDFLSNIVYPILYSDFDEEFKLQAVELLSDSKSSVAIPAIKYLISITDNEKVKQACNLALKKLHLAGASEQKAQIYFKNIIKDSKPAEFYTTIPDGNGNQALLSSRVNKADKYTFSAVVINDTSGIVDCFGFYNIPKSEFDKITEKFFNSEGQYKVSPEYIKYQTNKALDRSKLLKRTIPYEFISWNTLLADIDPLKNFDSSNKKTYTKDEITDILTLNYTYRWYITIAENKRLKSLIDEIYNLENIDILRINNLFKSALNEIFTHETKEVWKNRIIELAYILTVNNKAKDADKFLNIACDEELFNLFISIILQRSVVNNFVIIKNKQNETNKTINIFKRNAQKNEIYKQEKIEYILDVIKKGWISE